MTAVVDTMTRCQQYYIGTETCIKLLVRIAKHSEDVRTWLFAVGCLCQAHALCMCVCVCVWC